MVPVVVLVPRRTIAIVVIFFSLLLAVCRCIGGHDDDADVVRIRRNGFLEAINHPGFHALEVCIIPKLVKVPHGALFRRASKRRCIGQGVLSDQNRPANRGNDRARRRVHAIGNAGSR